MSNQPLPEDVSNAMRAGRKVDAIRLLREHTGLGLAAAKAAVEANALPPPPQGGARGFADPGQLPSSVRAALDAGHKIEAIRLLCQARGIGLKEAKTIVDGAQAGPARRSQPTPSSLAPGQVGHSPFNAGLWIVLAVVLGFVVWRILGQ
jgi:ribosomal protein L7/L12